MTTTLNDMPSKKRPDASVEEVAAKELVRMAQEQGLSLTGPDGLLKQFTKNMLDTALNEEMTEHLGHEKNRAAGDRDSSNVRNGTRPKTVLTHATGRVELEVPRDRDGSFEPIIVKKRQRRLGEVDEIVLSLYPRGLITGEISAHFEHIYGASVSKETISRITDKVLEEMQTWATRPLDEVYAAIFVDAIMVKVRDGQVANRPIYAAIGVSLSGEKDVLGLWAGTGGEGAKFWMSVLTDLRNRGVKDTFFGLRRLKALPEVVGNGWPLSTVQTCVIHLIRNTFRLASRRDWDAIKHDVKPIYTAVNANAARAALEELTDKWGTKYGAIIRLCNNAWEEFIPFLDYGACRGIACRRTPHCDRSVMMGCGQVVPSRAPGPADAVAGGHARVAAAGSLGVVCARDGRGARHLWLGGDAASRWSGRRGLRPADAVGASDLRVLPGGAVVAADRADVHYGCGVPGAVRPRRP